MACVYFYLCMYVGFATLIKEKKVCEKINHTELVRLANVYKLKCHFQTRGEVRVNHCFLLQFLFSSL